MLFTDASVSEDTAIIGSPEIHSLEERFTTLAVRENHPRSLESHGCQAMDTRPRICHLVEQSWGGRAGGGPERHILNLYPGNDYTWTSLKIAPQVILTHSPPLRIRTPVLGILDWISRPLPSNPSKPSRARGHPSELPMGSTRG